jgi:hypothetical protein
MPIEIGDMIDLRLRVVGIRHGFFSNVYVVEEPYADGPRRLTLKRLRFPFSMRGRNLALFRHEGRIACSVPPSWFLGNAIGYRNTDHGEALISEYVEGPSAAEWLNANAAKGVRGEHDAATAAGDTARVRTDSLFLRPQRPRRLASSGQLERRCPR